MIVDTVANVRELIATNDPRIPSDVLASMRSAVHGKRNPDAEVRYAAQDVRAWLFTRAEIIWDKEDAV